MKLRTLIAILTPMVLLAGDNIRATDSSVEIRNRWPVGASLLFVAAPGTPVRKGAVVAILDPAPLIAEVQRLENLLSIAQAEEKRDQLALANQPSPDLSTLNALSEAEEALKLFTTHDAVIGELALQQSVTDTSAGYDQQLVRFNARDQLLKEGFIQKPEYELEGAKLESARIAASLAKAKLNRFLTAEKPKKEADLNQKITEAKAKINFAETQNTASKAQLSARLSEAGKRIALLQNAVAAVKDQLAAVAQCAPIPAVYQSRPEESAPPIHIGSMIGPGELIGYLQPSAQ